MTGRQLSAFRAAWGASLVVAPSMPLRALTGGREPAGGAGLLRLLGARHLLQGAATMLRPTAGTLRLGAVADALHCASGVAFAAADDRERRAALLDAAVAAAWAASSLRTAR